MLFAVPAERKRLISKEGARPVKFDENKLAPKKAGTTEEKYNRILRASEEALERSNRLLRRVLAADK